MINNEQFKDPIDGYLNLLDGVSFGEGMFFKDKSQKDDLETKVWHFLHKIDAARYHESMVKNIAENMKDKLRDFMQKDEEKAYQTQSESTFEVEDKEILFEVDAFFTASRSALDFLASILSRYIKGKETDKIRGCVKFFEKDSNSSEVKRITLDMWNSWGQDLIDYRDYLVHNGALNPPKAIVTKVIRNQNISNSMLKEIAILEDTMNKQILKRGKEYIVFPLPKKPNKKLRITRMNKRFERETSGMPEGFSKEEYGGSIQIGEEKIDSRRVRYVLDSRYLEADELCSKYCNYLLAFCYEIFNELLKVNFRFLM
jgi:hypothetical protein